MWVCIFWRENIKMTITCPVFLLYININIKNPVTRFLCLCKGYLQINTVERSKNIKLTKYTALTYHFLQQLLVLGSLALCLRKILLPRTNSISLSQTKSQSFSPSFHYLLCNILVYNSISCPKLNNPR